MNPLADQKVAQDTGGSGAGVKTIGLEDLLAVSNTNSALNLSILPTPAESIRNDIFNLIQHKLVVESSSLARVASARSKSKETAFKYNAYQASIQQQSKP